MADAMLSPATRRALLEARYPTWTSLTLAQALDLAVDRYADRPFVITDERSYSYREIRDWSRRLASALIARGVQQGDHVALVLANYAEYVALKFAIARAGATAVPINFLLRQHELSYVLEQSDATVLITMDRLRDRHYLADLDAIIPGWETRGGGDKLAKLRDVFVFPTGAEQREGTRDVNALALLRTPASDAELLERESNGDPHFRADVIYTSGTTGRPKGVMISHDMILRVAYGSAYAQAFEDGRRILFALPMYHVFGYIECLMASTFVGGAIIPHVAFDPARMLEAAERHRATQISCVPMMTLKLIELARQRGFNNRHLIAMFNSGGVNPPTIWREIREMLGAKEIFSAYGMTETTASTTCTLPEDPDDYLLRTNGKLKPAGVAGDPALGGKLALYKTIDPETGADLPIGTPGELMVRGPIVTAGYYKKPDETRAAFSSDGWLHTGDVGIVDSEGCVTLSGRIKETYRCGGEMVMPREIEDLLTGHPLIAQALVVGIPDPKMGEVGCICIVPAGLQRPDPQELIDLCSARLARFKVPRHVIFIAAEDVPLTATGRPQKFLLAQLAKEALSANAPLAFPLPPTATLAPR